MPHSGEFLLGREVIAGQHLDTGCTVGQGDKYIFRNNQSSLDKNVLTDLTTLV